MKTTRRPFLKMLLASIAGWFASRAGASGEIAAKEFSNRKEPTLLTFYDPCRVWVSEEVPPLKPKSATHWLKISTGEVFSFNGEEWIAMLWRNGREVAIEGRPIGFIVQDFPGTETPDFNRGHEVAGVEKWIGGLPALAGSEFLVKCEGCGAQIDLNKPKMVSRLEILPNGAHWEHIDRIWESVRIEVDGAFRDFRLCQSCVEKATITYEV